MNKRFLTLLYRLLLQIPAKYQKTEDPCVVNMNQTNVQRTAEVDMNRGTLEKLSRQKKALEQSLKEAQQSKEFWRKKLDDVKSKQNSLIDSIADGKNTDCKNRSSVSSVGHMAYQSAPKGTMSKLLQNL